MTMLLLHDRDIHMLHMVDGHMNLDMMVKMDVLMPVEKMLFFYVFPLFLVFFFLFFLSFSSLRRACTRGAL